MQNKGKAILAFLYAVATVAVPLFSGDHVPSSTEWVQIAIAVATFAGVYLAPVIPEAPWAKSALGAVLAGLQVLVTVIDGGVNGNDVLMIVFAVAGALGIVLAPATSANGAHVGWGSDSYALAA